MNVWVEIGTEKKTKQFVKEMVRKRIYTFCPQIKQSFNENLRI